MAVGPTGTDRSDDGGENWAKLGGEGFHADRRWHKRTRVGPSASTVGSPDSIFVQRSILSP